MRSERRKKIMTLSILLVAILLVSVGFAAFSGTLIIKSKAVINPNPNLFDVKLSTANSIPATSGTVVPTKYPSSETIGYSKQISANNLSIDGTTTISDLNIAFVSPGDEVSYKFYVVNEGQYKAYLNNINLGRKTCTPLEDTQDSLVQEACNGININISVGLRTYTLTKNISNHELNSKKGEEVIITIKYDSNAGRADGPFTVKFEKISLVYSTVNSSDGEKEINEVCKLTNDINGDKDADLGDEVTCGTESFYIIPNDSSVHPTAIEDNITLLAKYNLDVGEVYSTGSKNSPIENPTGIQSTDAYGYLSNGYPHYGVIKFSETNYWGSVANFTFVYNSESFLYPHVENYKTYMRNLGIDVKEASLVSKKQYDSFKSYPNFNVTSFWFGYANASDAIYRLRSDGLYNAYKCYTGNQNGVRPIIVIPKSNIDV